MDKQIDFKELGEQRRSDNRVPGKDGESDILKANRLLIFKRTDRSKLVTNAKGNGKLDFHNDYFAGCFTANSIYFWEDPMQHLMEIRRVLRPGGKLTLAFIEKNSGEKLPWTLPDFTFYKLDEVEKLFQKAGFINIQVKKLTSEIIHIDEHELTTPFVIISGQKHIGLN